jgi:hypothetical protein
MWYGTYSNHCGLNGYTALNEALDFRAYISAQSGVEKLFAVGAAF